MLEIYKKVLTDFGSQCQAQALSGKKITFTVFQLGDGEYTGEETVETLMAMNALKSTKQEFGISKMELSEDSDTIILTLIAINSEVNIGYNIREIGIFAKDANGAQGLYSICVAKKDKPDWMPAYNGIDPVTLVYRDYLRVGNVENISVDLNSGGLATEKMLEETATELRSEIETLEFEDYTGEGAAVPETREAIAAIVSGIKRPTLISKIKAALMGLVTLGEMRALLVNNGLCTEPGKYFMDAAFGKMLQDQISDVNSNLALRVENKSLIDTILPILDTIGKTCSGFFRVTTDLTTQSQGYAYGFTAYRIHEKAIRVMANKAYSGIVELYDYETDKSAWIYKGSLVSDTQQVPVVMTKTRTENPHVSETSFNRINAFKIGPNLILVSFNLTIDGAPLEGNRTFVEIGRINGISRVYNSAFFDIPAQNGSGTVLMDFAGAGVMRIYNEISQNPATGWVRTSFVAVVDFD